MLTCLALTMPQETVTKKIDAIQISFEKCENTLLNNLLELKKMNVLVHSLSPKDKTSDFEILGIWNFFVQTLVEFYGDAVMLEWISYKLMQAKRFLNPNLLTKIRQGILVF